MTAAAQANRGRTCLFRLIAVAAPVLVAAAFGIWLLFQRGWLVVAEGSIQFVRPPLYLAEPGHEKTGHRYLYDKTLGWRNIPNWTATTNGRPLTINANGLRASRDYEYEKPAGAKRILVLGDSYAWGYGVADDELFTELLEQSLNAKAPEESATSTWEVINSGVSGWGTDQQLLYLKQEGLRYQPDIVVVAFFLGNDLDNNVAASQYGLNKPVFTDRFLSLGNVPVPRPGQSVDPYVARKVSALDSATHTASLLASIATTCEQNDCEVVLMKFGLFLAPTQDYALGVQRAFQDALTAAQIDLHYLDLDKVFADRGHDMRRLTTGNDDGHWNAFGHGEVAKILDSYLRKEQLAD